MSLPNKSTNGPEPVRLWHHRDGKNDVLEVLGYLDLVTIFLNFACSILTRVILDSFLLFWIQLSIPSLYIYYLSQCFQYFYTFFLQFVNFITKICTFFHPKHKKKHFVLLSID